MIQYAKGRENMPDTLVPLLLVVILILMILVVIRLFSSSKDDTRMHQFESSNREYMNRAFNELTDRFDSRIKELNDRNVSFERATAHNLIEFQSTMNTSITTQFKTLQDTVEKRLGDVDKRVSDNLMEGFKKTNDTFTNIVSRLSKIDEAQKKIDSLSTDIVSLQNVLTDKKTRGTFGEVQLSQILSSIFGKRNDKIYQLQYSFNTGSRVDAVLFAPEPLGTLAIDSKFPLENYRKMTDTELSDVERYNATKLFVADCKKHIDDIASKYIIPRVTSDQAIMFVPAEAIFATISAYHQDILDYSQRKRVWLASPTTLMSTLTTIQTILMNLEREKYASVIHEQLKHLSVEFDRYRERWQRLSNRMDGLSSDFKNINITTEKISKRFEEISNVEIKHSNDDTLLKEIADSE